MSESQSERIERILEKLKQVREKGLKCFGAESHKYRLNPPIEESALKRFEEEHDITLPLDYRTFLKLAGNGGGGPYYGIYKLDEWKDFVDWVMDDIPPDILALPCPLHPQMSREADWESQFHDSVSPYQGIISIGSQGCTYETGLIVTGEFAGRVVYLDANGYAPYVVREPDFLSWYERWLDELLGGYDMFWFGYGIGGTESQLLELLQDPVTPDAGRIDAIYAIRRLPQLSPKCEQSICSLIHDPIAGVRAAACSVAEKFKIVEVAKFVADLLGDEAAVVQKEAIGLSMTLLGDAHQEVITQLLFSDNSEVAEQALFKLRMQEALPRDILLQVVQWSLHEGVRASAMNRIKWRLEDNDLLIRLLDDKNCQVRFYAVLGLRGNRASSVTFELSLWRSRC